MGYSSGSSSAFKANVFICYLFIYFHAHQQHVALVTGGASGIGHGVVQRFLKEGAIVVIMDLPTSRGAELAAGYGEKCMFFGGDVSLLTKTYVINTDISCHCNSQKELFLKLGKQFISLIGPCKACMVVHPVIPAGAFESYHMNISHQKIVLKYISRIIF